MARDLTYRALLKDISNSFIFHIEHLNSDIAPHVILIVFAGKVVRPTVSGGAGRRDALLPPPAASAVLPRRASAAAAVPAVQPPVLQPPALQTVLLSPTIPVPVSYYMIII